MAIGATFRLFGIMLLMLAVGMALMVLVCLSLGDMVVAGRFLGSSLVTGFVGGAFMLGLPIGNEDAHRRDGVVLFALSMILFPFFAGLPMIGGVGSLSLLQAWFEATSMWTTTGATLVTNIEALSPALMFWRALLGWIGGLGMIVVAIAFLARLHYGGLGPQYLPMPHGEGDTLMDQIRQTARTVFPIYIGGTIVLVASLMAVQLEPFEALIYGMGSIATSGIGIHPHGLDALNNDAAGLIIAAGSLFGALSFSLHWRALRARPELYGRDPETVAFFALFLVAFVLVGLELFVVRHYGGGQAVWVALVDVAAFLSTSGYTVSTGPAHMIGLNTVILMGVMICGGATASTASGLRPMRLMMMLKQSDAELDRLSYPNIAVRMRYGEQRIDQQSMYGTISFFVLTLGVLMALALGFALDGVSFEYALYAAVAAFANCGPILERVTAGEVSIHQLSDWGLTVYMLGMILGRMEIIALLVFTAPAYWRR